MKNNNYIFLLAVVAFVFAACNNELDTSSPSKFEDKTIYNSVFFTENAVMGAYAMVADANMYAQRVSMNWSTNNDIEFVGADENSYNQVSNRGSSNYFATAGNSTLGWTNIYRLIERSNLIIDGIRSSKLLNDDDASKRMYAMLGETLTMRAMGYFELVKHWGDVPFKLEPTSPDLSNVYLDKTNRDTIYKYIIADLQEAANYVPWMGEMSYNVERINKGFVKGLLARVALSAGGYSLRDKPGFPMERPDNYREFYEIANQACRDIINKGIHKLNPSYLSVWKNVNALTWETTYNENLYEVALGLGQTGEIGYSIGVRFYNNSKYGYGNNTNVVNTSAYYFYSFDRTDVRRDITIATAMYSNSAGELKEIYQNNPLSYNIAKCDQRWMNSSWLKMNLEAQGKLGYGINWIAMRYADVLLMFAETENELQGAPTAEAKDALKAVRARAFGPALQTEKVQQYVDGLTTKAQFFEAIVNERAWEFGGEAIRKFDLIRWNLLQDKIEEQRTAFIAMLNGEPVNIMGNNYNALPTAIYYKYKADNENIDRDDINYYSQRDDLDVLTAEELKALGYTKVAWMAGASVANKTSYTNRINLFSSGLQQSVNGVCNNRYLYPINSTAISDSQGKLSNSFGY